MNKKNVDSTIDKLSGHPTLVGYRQLAAAVRFCLEHDSFPARGLTITLYPNIANDYQRSPDSVTRSISRAVDDFWLYGNREKLEQIAGRKIREKPTPGEFSFYLYRYFSR